MRLPASRYVAPDLPFVDDGHDGLTTSCTPPVNVHERGGMVMPFVNSHRHAASYPRLDRENWTFLNHGAFGLGLEAGLRRAESWRIFAETQPLRYFDRHLLNHMVHGARGMIDFVTRDEDDASWLRKGTAMIQNVTSGMNAFIGGHHRRARARGDGTGSGYVFYYDIAYGSNKKICIHHHGRSGYAFEIPFEENHLPLLRTITTKTGGSSSLDADDRKDYNLGDWDDDAARIYISALDSTICKFVRDGGIDKSSISGSLLILDHITSNTAIRCPISSIAKYAKEEYGMIVVVDGAHALWSLPLDVAALLTSADRPAGCGGHVDGYVTNCHKWFSSPRGAAVLFCGDPDIRDTILDRPAVVSHGVDDGFISRFMWDGCRDYSSQLALPAVLDYWNAVDLVAARMEVRTNLREGICILRSHWHPDVDESCVYDDDGRDSAEAGLTLVALGMHAPTMALVRLPDRISGGVRGNGQSNGIGDRKTSTDAKKVQDYLYECGVEVPVKCVQGVLYARVSCHLYNSADEFDRLGRAASKYVAA